MREQEREGGREEEKERERGREEEREGGREGRKGHCMLHSGVSSIAHSIVHNNEQPLYAHTVHIIDHPAPYADRLVTA